MTYRKFKSNQLVRNNRLKIMQDDGIIIEYEILDDENYLLELKIKAIEEANEILNTKNDKELIEEIADLYEVIEHIIDIRKINLKDIEDYKEKKKNKTGAFDKKIKILSVEVDENNPCFNNGFNYLEYFLSQPDKYPEIN